MRNLARWSYRHRRLVVVLWLVLAIATTAVVSSAGTRYSNTFTFKGTDSARAIALLHRAAPKVSGDSDQIVIATRGEKVTDPAVRARVQRMLGEIAALPHVGGVASPYGAGGARRISRTGTIAYATVTFDELAQAVPVSLAKRVISVAQSVDGPKLQVQLGGQVIERAAPPGIGGLGLGIVAALIVLLLVFGSALAALVPLLVAGFALTTGVAVMGLVSHLISMPTFSEQLSLLIGLGVGVDYALFIVTRYRQAMMRGRPPEEAVVEALDTSGRSVLFAGITVCIALLGMIALGLSFLSGLGIAAAIVVACTVLAALTLLPALLGFFGARVLTRRSRRALAAGTLTVDDESPAWGRWARALQKRPMVFAIGATVLMLVIAIPVLSLRLGSDDAGSDPSGTTTYKAYNLLAKGFGPGSNGPLQLVAAVDSAAQRDQFAHILTVVRRLPDVVSVTPEIVLSGRVATAQVIERGSPQAASTSNLLSDLRDRVIPRNSGAGLHVLVGGSTAIFADFATVISGKLPLFVTVVVLLSFILLMAVFRSIVIPLMAAAMNLLSVAAAFGVVTAVFQNGWLAGLVGVSRTGPIASFLPVIVFAILFGLSMDYEVFLVSRIYEEWHHRRDNTEAVIHGLSATGRTITAAAAIMVLVFAAFVLGGQIVIKLFGVGLASAVFLDAVVVRSVLVPGLMIAIGKRNWALPAALDRILPQLNVEGDSRAPQDRDDDGAAPAPVHNPVVHPDPLTDLT
jgi:RND superfamily putative drug exporter